MAILLGIVIPSERYRPQMLSAKKEWNTHTNTQTHNRVKEFSRGLKVLVMRVGKLVVYLENSQLR